MNLVIELADAGRPSRRLNISQALTTIGRSRACDVHIDSDIVSSRHARLKSYRDHIVIEDLDSTNGLFVNGEPVVSATPVSDGDVIQLGIDGPLLTIIRGAGPFPPLSGRAISSAVSGRGSRSAGNTQRWILIASVLFGTLLCFTAALAAVVLLIAGPRRDSLEITSMTDPRLSQAVGLVICGAELAVDGHTSEVRFGTGSAFVVTSDGYLLTNRHVVEGFHRGPQELMPVLLEQIKEVPEEERKLNCFTHSETFQSRS